MDEKTAPVGKRGHPQVARPHARITRHLQKHLHRHSKARPVHGGTHALVPAPAGTPVQAGLSGAALLLLLLPLALAFAAGCGRVRRR